jgi:hypothetical protein
MQMKKILFLSSILGLMVTLMGCGNGTDAKAQQEQARAQKALQENNAKRLPTGSYNFLSGPVIKIYGNIPGVESSSISISGKGVSGGGETVRLGQPIYGIHIQTSNGVYVIQFHGDCVYAVSSLITNGTRVKFPTRYYLHNDYCSDNREDCDVDLFGLNHINLQGWMNIPYWDGLVEILPPEPTLLEQKQK